MAEGISGGIQGEALDPLEASFLILEPRETALVGLELVADLDVAGEETLPTSLGKGDQAAQPRGPVTGEGRHLPGKAALVEEVVQVHAAVRVETALAGQRGGGAGHVK